MSPPSPQLPYYEDSHVKLTQSVAIARHIGAAHGLLGKSHAETDRVNVWVDQTVDFRGTLSRAVYGGSPSFDELAKDKLPAWLAGFERALGDREWVAGPLSIADFMLCEALAHARAIAAAKAGVPDILAPYPKLHALVARFEGLPRVAAFLASPAAATLPWNGPCVVVASSQRAPASSDPVTFAHTARDPPPPCAPPPPVPSAARRSSANVATSAAGETAGARVCGGFGSPPPSPMSGRDVVVRSRQWGCAGAKVCVCFVGL